MKLFIILVALTLVGCKNDPNPAELNKAEALPPIFQEVRHGELYTDHFHWLRDTETSEISSPPVLKYLESEKQKTKRYFASKSNKISEVFAEIKSRLPQGQTEDTWENAGHTLHTEYQQNGEYRIWYYLPPGSSHRKLLLDENIRSKNQLSYKLLSLQLSPNAKYLAWVENSSGVHSLHIKSVDGNAEIIQTIDNVKDDIEWSRGSDTIYYVELDEYGREYKVVSKSIGSGAEYKTLYEEQDDERFVFIHKSLSNKYLIINSLTWSSSEVRILDLTKDNAVPTLVFSRDKEATFFLDHINGTFIVESNILDENSDVFKYTTVFFDEEKATKLIDSSAGTIIKETIVFEKFIATHERKNGVDQLRITDINTGFSHFVKFDDEQYGLTFGDIKQSLNSNILRVRYESLLTPRTVYEYNVDTKQIVTKKTIQIPGYKKADYIAKQLKVDTSDGVQVPVSIIYHKDTPPSKTQPLYLYVYGSYGEGIPPEFPIIAMSLINRGFTYAIAHVRGGDELGNDWHEQGRLMNRKNSFSDFLSVANYLVSANFVKKGNIHASAESAGGTIVAVALNKEPELFKKVAMLVPFVDVVNTLMDETLNYTIADWDEFGNPKKDPAVYKYQMSYSPYDNIQPQDYPGIYVSAAIDDPAVGYWEVAKWVSKINKLRTNNEQLIFDIRNGGHIKGGRYERYHSFAKFIVFFLDDGKG
ncbi:prolyl oligopeptidase family serine peptidase [Paraglaciecola sp. L1A13]|uniref:prolyl oligopeptidase family serine peptidase n=1 Tax=Paraglaciecola sp. L1A13 TaxID=2686359 RepID=UPI00131B7026|nr:prolyl oligopeptidase family serine peptidase [Paraglaciecola sp. L1A13]